MPVNDRDITFYSNLLHTFKIFGKIAIRSINVEKRNRGCVKSSIPAKLG